MTGTWLSLWALWAGNLAVLLVWFVSRILQ
jgi:hypothetical protein